MTLKYQIELINFGNDDNQILARGIEKFNEIQNTFYYGLTIFKKPNDFPVLSPGGGYLTDNVFHKLMSIRESNPGPSRHMVGIIHEPLHSRKFVNLFGLWILFESVN